MLNSIDSYCLTQDQEVHPFTASAVGQAGIQTERSDGRKPPDRHALTHPHKTSSGGHGPQTAPGAPGSVRLH